MTDAESFRLAAYLFATVRTHEHYAAEYFSGALDERILISYQSGLIGNLSTPQTRKWWDAIASGPTFPDDFVAYVNELLERVPIDTLNGDVQIFR